MNNIDDEPENANINDMLCIIPGFYPKSYSFGFINNDNSFSHTIPSMLAYISLMFFASKAVYYSLRPLKQPRVVCDLIAGIIIGPSFLGNIKSYHDHLIKGSRNAFVLRTLSIFGILFHLFLIGVKMDPKMIFKAGHKALVIALGSIVIPLTMSSLALQWMLQADVLPQTVSKRSKGLNFFVSTLSLSSFPVIADLLNELHLLNSELGRTALSASMCKDLIRFSMMQVFAVMNQVNISKGEWKRVLADAVGASYVAGPIIAGLVVPDGPPLGTALVKHTEMFITEVFLPLFYVGLGQMVDLPLLISHKAKEDESWALWLLVLIIVAYIGNMTGTVVSSIYSNMAPINAFLLGLTFNTKGVLELLTYIRFYNNEIVDKPGLALIIVTAILETGAASFAIESMYNPLGEKPKGGRSVQSLRAHSELRMVACVHNDRPIPFMINLMDALCSEGHPMCVYLLHMVELSGRADSALITHKDRNGFVNMSQMDPMLNIFIQCEKSKEGHLAVQPFTAKAPFKSMHHDVCAMANDRNTHIVIVPFPRKGVMDAGPDKELDQSARNVVSEVLDGGPCTVGILVYEVFGYTVIPSLAGMRHNIGVLFWGGVDDREALACAARMALQEKVELSVLRFMPVVEKVEESNGRENELEWSEDRVKDEEMLEMVREVGVVVVVEEVEVSNVEETMAVIRTMNEKQHDLIVVGRRQGEGSFLEELAEWCEFQELGVIGDMLASDFKHTNSILVVQKQD
ncbi:cation/H(+) antiporter 15-like [Dioscorea cayenensis subsp. rotundata]|uniref:Cation/H(+) antiporter 15-like n=1 Tax=Dioscorea cayennensis subsp. rotundata TaxID=55577 RepID=A0AB40C432_DIOCR|nr:cation/H(+) antiporter 15-like [Dioscorea cayenensis subsp. rotundata]